MSFQSQPSTIPATRPVLAVAPFAVDVSGILSTLNTIWNIYSIIAFFFSALFVFGIVYALQRSAQLGAEAAAELRAAEAAWQARMYGAAPNDRWRDVQTHIQSANPNDWRLAIIEADILLEEALQERGYAGNTIGERLKSASPQQLPSIDDAWKAHRVRNEIAHAGSDFVLTQKVAQVTILQFERALKDLGKV